MPQYQRTLLPSVRILIPIKKSQEKEPKNDKKCPYVNTATSLVRKLTMVLLMKRKKIGDSSRALRMPDRSINILSIK